MSSSKRIYELQQVDLSIQAKNKELEGINLRINRDEAYELAKANHDAAREAQKEREKQYKELDAEAENVRSALQKINDKLYGGKIKNPKELVGYEQEASMLKGNLSGKDDVLLELMEKIDSAKTEIKKLQEIYKMAETDWQSRKVTLTGQADQLKEELAGLENKRQEILAVVDKETLTAYENIKSRKGQAVVRVEQGRCLGCRVSLSISELQRVRGMSIVTCSNCGRILYLS
ncbi:MAG: C4-type zinc ribbon domain-containing protein [Dehalococcoidia bacterium]|jgi:predicted  nucleic acid-binding Zn-ribbon protein